MAALLFDLLALLLVLTILRARPAVVLTLMAASVLVVPGPFVVPHAPTSLLTFDHLLTLAGLGRLALGRIDGSLQARHLRLTPLQVVAMVLLATTAIVGVVLSPDAGPLGGALGRLTDVVDHLAFLTVVLALTRRTSPRVAVDGLALGLAIGVAIAVVEHVTRHSYGHGIFSAVHDVHQDAAFPLSVRGGSVRVRAGTEFALQYAWIAAMLAPALLVAAWRRGGAPLAAAAAGLTLTTVYWSYSRTALVATAIAILVASVVLARRAALGVLATIGAVGAIALVTSPSLRDHLNPNADIGSIHERTRRLSAVMEVASHHPFRGVGLGNLAISGFQTTDFAFLIAYVETGVIGLVAVTAVLLFALAAVAPAIRVADLTLRDEAMAAALGVVIFVISTVAYDAFTLIQSTHALWLAAAVGIVLAEGRARHQRVLRWSARGAWQAAAIACVGLLAGLMVRGLAPTHSAQRAYFTVLNQTEETRDAYDPITPAQRFVNTVCTLAEATRAPTTNVSCADTFGAAGVGQIRLQAPNSFALRQAFHDLETTVTTTARIRDFRLLPLDDPTDGPDTWARTAPVWGALSAAALALIVASLRASRGGPAPPPAASGARAPAPAPRPRAGAAVAGP